MKRLISRRKFQTFLCGAMLSGAGTGSRAQGKADGSAADTATTPDEWIGRWRDDRVKKLLGPLDLRRFRDPVYILLREIGWKHTEAPYDLPAVTVPAHFVTDFASVPRPFWSMFRPDGNYAYAAVLHDYLYWEQPFSKQLADEIFKSVMLELSITDRQAGVLFAAVKTFGQASWDGNLASRRRGARRVLKKLPDDPLVTWEDWRKNPDVFI